MVILSVPRAQPRNTPLILGTLGMLLGHTLLLGAGPKPHNGAQKRAFFRHGAGAAYAIAKRPQTAPKWPPVAAGARGVQALPLRALRGALRLCTLLKLPSCAHTRL